MKKIISLILALALLLCTFSFAAIAEDEKPGKGMFVAAVTPAGDHGFTAEAVKHTELALELMAEEYGFEFQLLTASDAAEQSNYIDTLLIQKPDLFFLWPMTGDDLKAAAMNIIDSGSKLVVFDRQITGIEPFAKFTCNDFMLGKQQALYFNEFFKDDIAAGETINFLRARGDSSTCPMTRDAGFDSVIDEAFNEIYAFQTDWSREKGMSAMESYLATASKEEVESIKAIFSHDDEPTMGILDAIMNYQGSAEIGLKLLSGVGGRYEFVSLFKEPTIEGCKFITSMVSPAMTREVINFGTKLFFEGGDVNVGTTRTYLIDNDGVLAKQICEADPAGEVGMSVDEYFASNDYAIREEVANMFK